MASKIEINTYFGQCTCCLRYAYLKSMWDKHEWNGETETYAEMLFECFGLNTWYTADENQDQICEDCITRLRDACQFKIQVLKIQKNFQNEAVENKKEIKPEMKSEESEDDNFEYIEYLDEDILDINNGTVENKKEIKTEMKSEESEDDNLEYIEYLDEDILDINNGTDERVPLRRRRRRQSNSDVEEDTEVRARPTKWPRKLPVSQRYQTYKQYTADDLRDCIEAIKRNEMSPKEASAYFKIPFKTITAKIRRGILEEENPIPLTKTRELIEDIKLILKYTNVTPFKTRFNQIMCAFCSNSYHHDDLKAHIVDGHPNRVARVEAMLRPYYENQMLKIDIQDLKCTICDIPALYWTDMLDHLSSKHNLTLKQAKTNIIPYLLSDNISCAICNENFSAFMLVDSHMNTHYSNYSCVDCGETFITLPRLKNHEKVHESGKYPCHLCSKVFPLNTYRRKHILAVHNKSNSLYKCRHCTESFSTETLRQKHMIKSHVEQIKVFNCEICGAMFYFNKMYKKHLRRKHNEENTCKICGKAFESDFLLKKHNLRHSGVREFWCEVCETDFFSKSSLKLHLRHHETKVNKYFLLPSEDTVPSSNVVWI